MPDIRVSSRELIITGNFKKEKRFRLQETNSLISSLMIIKDSCNEKHTKENLDKLIHMILRQSLDH